MGLLNWFKREKHPSNNFNDEDREYAIRAREQKRLLKEKREELELATLELKAKKDQIKLDLEIQKLQQELEDMQSDDEDLSDMMPEPENAEDKMLAVLLSKVLNQTPVATSIAPTPLATSKDSAPSTGVSISDEEIDKYIATIPKRNLAMAKNSTMNN